MTEHKTGRYKGFSWKYNVSKMVYYEFQESADKMLKRERRLKNWNRDWKIELINNFNPSWADLSQEFLIENVK